MLWSDLICGVLFLCQAGVGILGNSVLLMVYVNVFLYQSHKKKPTDLIVTLLTLVNVTAAVTRGVPMAMVSLGMRINVDEVGCTVLFFTYRMSRGLSICITCLLSMFQAVTISPSTSRWAQLKPRAPKYILPSFLFFCILNLLMYLGIISSTQATRNVSDSKYTFISKHCSMLPSGSYVLMLVCYNAITLRDFLFVGLMSWASGYMVIVLYRHHKQVQHIHSTIISSTASPEIQATHTILLLVSCFVCFYLLNGTIVFYFGVTRGYDAHLQNILAFVSACYPSFCPLVLISKDSRVPKSHSFLRKLSNSSPTQPTSCHPTQ
ncbi:vomeronasal 1 receptor ornAnaV1R3049 [Ornithorhynchus anatinus]|uniref:Vomeronasal type-1 receptor n=1 Tax=Ornithorhynchus anatinus TaxID=9258 RepID=F7CML3_ORNAN|nr:vomeronasal 1 receptor ornAnaV1R3049 [Ornithorhynchus anatinus]